MMDENQSGDKKSVRPFFIMAVKSGPDYALEVLNGLRKDGGEFHYVSSEHIMRFVDVIQHGAAGVTKVTMSDEKVRYIPLPPEEILSLMEQHGYKVYGPKDTRELHQRLQNKEKKFTLE